MKIDPKGLEVAKPSDEARRLREALQLLVQAADDMAFATNCGSADDALTQARTALEATTPTDVKSATALRQIAEGDYGPGPQQMDYQTIRGIARDGLAATEPSMKMQVTPEWLREKTASDPDLPVEVIPKNAGEAQPVAWQLEDGDGNTIVVDNETLENLHPSRLGDKRTPLYLHPSPPSAQPSKELVERLRAAAESEYLYGFDDTCKLLREAATALSQPPETDAVAAEREAVAAWRDISTAPLGYKIIAGYWNALGHWRTITARYYTSGTLDLSDDAPETEDGFAPAGWYEESDTHETLLPCTTPTHWMPLPVRARSDVATGGLL